MRFKEYVEQRIGREIDLETEWHDTYTYDEWEDRYFQDYLDDMETQGYEPKFGYDY